MNRQYYTTISSSMIGSGVCNCITSPANTYSCYSFIGAGRCNVVNACFSSIVGGGNNTVSGIHSAILGGCANTINHNFSGIFGNGINTVSSNTFHVNCLNACDTPAAAGQPPGSIVWRLQCSLLPTDRVLVIIP